MRGEKERESALGGNSIRRLPVGQPEFLLTKAPNLARFLEVGNLIEWGRVLTYVRSSRYILRVRFRFEAATGIKRARPWSLCKNRRMSRYGGYTSKPGLCTFQPNQVLPMVCSPSFNL